jgi:hypothetical protein
MKVDSGIFNHPKFLKLKLKVGDCALEALCRIWAHCENGQKGEYWRKADCDFVEMVADWKGVKSDLYAALAECGWIKEEAKGIRIHDWNLHNWRRVSNWALGRRPKHPAKANGKPTGSHGSANAKPTGSPLNELTGLNEVQGNKKREAEVVRSRTQFAALKAVIESHPGRNQDSEPEERSDYRKKCAELAALQKRQAAGHFSNV